MEVVDNTAKRAEKEKGRTESAAAGDGSTEARLPSLAGVNACAGPKDK